jgi:hypothetical protein
MDHANGKEPGVRVVIPQPVETSWTPGIADIPDPKNPGRVQKWVVLDIWGPTGLSRYFLEPYTAEAIAAQLTQCAKDAKAGNLTVIEGAQAQQISRDALRWPEG